jgi:hypothetical protein
MTNTEIIATAMMLNGIDEESHTFARWKKMGYKVRKGEHAAFRATIWKASERKVEVDGEEQDALSMFMKNACFFTRSQVEQMA